MFLGVAPPGTYALCEIPGSLDLSIPDPLSELLANPPKNPLYLVIATPYDPVTEQEVTVYLASGRYWTKPTDTPANQLFLPVLRSPYNVQINLFSGASLSPSTVPGFGDITLALPGGSAPNQTLDHLLDYSWHNRDVEVYCGEAGAAFSTFARIFKGTAAGVQATLDTLSIQLRDLQPRFDIPIQSSLCLGTGRDSLELSFSMVSAAAGYHYVDMTSVTNYTIQSGDKLEYEIYWPTSGNLQIGFDYECTDGTFFRGSALDQNGISSHPQNNISAYAYGQWYRRVFSIPAGHVGKTIQYYDLATEYDAGGTIKAYIRNIKITDSTGTTLRKAIWTSNSSIPTTAVHITQNASNSLTLYSRYEGTDAEKGKPKPLSYGKVFNRSAVLVHSSSLVYQVHDRTIEAIDAVKDKGAALTFAGYVSNVDSWTPVASNYIADKSRGLIRLGSNPSGQITVDLQGDAEGGYVSSTANIIQRIITQRAGLTYPDDFDANSFSSVNSSNSAVIGFATDLNQTTISESLNSIMAGVGGYWTFDRQSLVKIGILTRPGVPTITLTELDVTVDGIERLPYTAPSKRQRLGYRPNWMVQGAADLATSLSPSEKSILTEQYQFVTAEDSSVGVIHKDAEEVESVSLFYNSTDAQTEVTRRQELFGLTPYRYRVPLTRGLFVYFLDTDLELKIPRFGLTDGQWFKVVSVVEDVENNNIVLELWGVGDSSS